jgi:DNA-damage-inducible protein D
LICYDEWRNFENVLDKAIVVAKTVHSDADYHFVDVNKMIALTKGVSREIKNFALSRYAPPRGKLKGCAKCQKPYTLNL